MPRCFFTAVVRCQALAALLLLCLLGPICMAGPALGREVINEFASTVVIQPDGSLLVREEITVTAEGNQIKRGIYRDFPLSYAGQEGKYKGQVPFTLISTSLDGRGLDVNDVERRGNVIRIKMRNTEKELSRGRHRFVLVYSTSLHLRYYEAHDELNWNVTGDSWAFPIKKASCLIVTPDNAPIDQTIAWIGPAGSKDGGRVAISRPGPNQALFEGRDASGDREIPPGEQFTAAVGFPKSVVANPLLPLLAKQEAEEAEQAARATSEPQDSVDLASANATPQEYLWRMLLLQGPAFLLVFAYFALIWFFRGRDPATGSVIPLFSPPVAGYMGKGAVPDDFHPAPMSPAAIEYLRGGESLSGRGIAALFLSLAARKLCSITRAEDGTYALTPHDVTDFDMNGISPEERAVHAELSRNPGTEGSLPLTPRSSAMRSLQSLISIRLHANYGKAWTFNSWYSVLGWMFVLPLGFSLSFRHADIPLFIHEALPPVPFVSLLAAMFMGGTLLAIRAKEKLPILVMAIFTLSGFAIFFSQGFFDSPQWILPLLMVVVSVVFSVLMKAPSKAAREIMDQIDGLHLYMAAAEKDRLAMLNRPDDTPGVFQDLLPYALALWLEKTWCDRFADQIAAGLLAESNVTAIGLNDVDSITTFMHDFSRAAASSTAASESSSSSGSASRSSAFSSDGSGGGSGSGGGGGGGGGL